MFIMQSHCHHSPFPSTKSLSKLSWNVMECLPTIPSPMSLYTDIARWVVNGANVEIPSTCSYMHWNLTWLDKTHAFMVLEGFEAQGCMSCLHNICDHPCFHQHSWCSLIVIICQSHHGMSSNKPIANAIIHRHRTFCSEWGQRWNSFNLCMYGSTFDMVR